MLVEIRLAEQAHEGEVPIDLSEVEDHAVVQLYHGLGLFIVSQPFFT